MSEAQNTQIIKDAFAAFGRGDIKAILDSLADNVVWQGVIGTEGVLPQSGIRRGRAAVAEFFKQVADTTDFTEFAPETFVAQGNIVVALGRYSAKMKPSGGQLSSSWVMVFTLENGKVVDFKEYSDSAKAIRAYKGVAAAV